MKVIGIAERMIKICKLLSIHQTGVDPIKISLNVPPPKAVTKAMIIAPNKSNFRSTAAVTPETAKAKVPQISIISTASNRFFHKTNLYKVISNL